MHVYTMQKLSDFQANAKINLRTWMVVRIQQMNNKVESLPNPIRFLYMESSLRKYI